jgi:hypothetical protein
MLGGTLKYISVFPYFVGDYYDVEHGKVFDR